MRIFINILLNHYFPVFRVKRRVVSISTMNKTQRLTAKSTPQVVSFTQATARGAHAGRYDCSGGRPEWRAERATPGLLNLTKDSIAAFKHLCSVLLNFWMWYGTIQPHHIFRKYITSWTLFALHIIKIFHSDFTKDWSTKLATSHGKNNCEPNVVWNIVIWQKPHYKGCANLMAIFALRLSKTYIGLKMSSPGDFSIRCAWHMHKGPTGTDTD